MRYKLLITLLIFASLQSARTFAQAKLAMHSINLPDTVSIGDRISIDITIKNKGNTAYSGFVNMLYKTQKENTFLVSGTYVRVSLSPNDTISIHIPDFEVTQASFISGKNIVVVWPTGTNPAPSDTISDTVFVNYPTGIEQGLMQSQEIVLSPNPVTDKLFITCNKDYLYDIESVRIFDMIGNEYSFKKQLVNELNLTSLPSGMYVLYLRFKDGTFVSRRFVKE